MSQNRGMDMKVIGITGGVGAGKSHILSYLENTYKDKVKILMADHIARELQMPGQECYFKVVEQFGRGILQSDMTIDRQKLANVVFSDREKLQMLNYIVHPAVKRVIADEIQKEREKGVLSFLFIEGALLIEDKYDMICDELWYIYTKEEVRQERLKTSRNYSEDKIRSIFQNQLKEDEFRKHCRVIIDNNTTKEAAYRQIEQWVERR